MSMSILRVSVGVVNSQKFCQSKYHCWPSEARPTSVLWQIRGILKIIAKKFVNLYVTNKSKGSKQPKILSISVVQYSVVRKRAKNFVNENT